MGGLGELRQRGPAGKPVGNLGAEARAGALSARSPPPAPPAAVAVAPTPYAGRGRGCLERGGGSAGGGGTPGPRRQPCRPTAGGRLARLQDPKRRGRVAFPSDPGFSSDHQKCKTFAKCAVPRRLRSPGRTAVLAPRACWNRCTRLGSQSGCARAGEERACERAAAEPAPKPTSLRH